jgi:hypothetical protein
MKSMNRGEGKKIAVMAAIIIGFMMIVFTPFAAATVTSFSVTPGTGLAGAVDSYDALVTTDGVTKINISIPAGFIAVTPMTGGVQIARVDFWNSSTLAYYGYATITSNNANPTTQVDVYCKLRVGGDEVEITTTQNVNYAAGATNTFESGFECDHSSAVLKLPTEDDDGCVNITIDCTDCPCFSENWRLDDVKIAIRQFVRNPTTADDYVFTTDDGQTATVTITAAGGCGIVFRNGAWFADTNGDHIANVYFGYGIAGDVPLIGNVDKSRRGVGPYIMFGYGITNDNPLVGDINRDGTADIAIFRDGLWCVNTTGVTPPVATADLVFGYGIAGDVPLVGDFNKDGTDDIAIFRNGLWCADTTGNRIADLVFGYGIAGDVPLVGDINKDGSDDIAIFRDGLWCVNTTGVTPPVATADLIFGYGIAGDVPLVGDIG